MLKQSNNAIGMLISKYEAVLKKMRLKNLSGLVAATILFCAAPAPASAANIYDVGINQTYVTLDDLLTNRRGKFQDGDTIIIHNTVNNLTATIDLDFNNKKVIIKPQNSTIAAIRFLELLQIGSPIDMSITASSLEISNFGDTSANGGDVFGGAIAVDNANSIEINATGGIKFSGNTVSTILESIDSDANSGEAKGGAIFADNNVTVKAGGEINFSGNKNSSTVATINPPAPPFYNGTTSGEVSGGAIFAGGKLEVTTTGGEITFSGNEVSSNASAVESYVNSGNASGGAIYADTTVDVTADGGEIKFSDNKASSTAKSTEINSDATSGEAKGGAIYAGTDVTVIGGGITFIGNEVSSTATSVNSDATSYTASGGAIFAGGNVTVGDATGVSPADKITFSGNKAFATAFSEESYNESGEAKGGAIFAGTDVTIAAAEITFSGNGAWSSATANALNDSANSREAYGGAIYAASGDVKVTTTAGGGITFSGNTAFSTAFSPNYSADSSDVYGGAIFAENGDVTVGYDTVPPTTGSKITFSANKAWSDATSFTDDADSYQAKGGVIFAYNKVKITADEINFSGNEASSTAFSPNHSTDSGEASGGAIYTYDWGAGDVTITGGSSVSFKNNKAYSTSFANGWASFGQVLGGAIHATGKVEVTANGEINFSGNEASSYATSLNDTVGSGMYSKGGAIYMDGNDVDVIAGDKINFSGNKTSSMGFAWGRASTANMVSGGAIYANNVTIKAGEIKFSGNEAYTYAKSTNDSSTAYTTYGGAIYASNQAIISGNEITFTKNTTSATASSSGFANSDEAYGGAIYANDGVTFSDITGLLPADRINFSGNTASSVASSVNDNAISESAYGGAIYMGWVQPSVINGNEITFTGNTVLSTATSTAVGGNASSSQAYGGAIYANSNITITGGNITFSDNHALSSATGATIFGGSAYGGAIYSGYGELSISGSHVAFTNNSANYTANNAYGGNAYGGAIYALNNVSITSSGNVFFKGNTANGAPNAIYMDGGNTLTLDAEEGRKISFYDPVASSNQNFTIDINKPSGGSTYTGTILFDTYQSKIYGNTTVHNGTMSLTNGASYGANNSPSSFTLKAGATLLSGAKSGASGNSNSINTNTITLDNGSILSFDLRDAVVGNTLNLKLDSQNNGNISDNNMIIDVKYLPGGIGTYNLATTTNGTVTVNNNPNNFTIRGEKAEDTRFGTTNGWLQEDTGTGTGTTLQLYIHRETPTGVVYWTDAAGNDTWNATSGDWDTTEIDNDASEQFFHGDAAVFRNHGVGTGDITIHGGGVQIEGRTSTSGQYYSGLTIEGNDNWTFSGGAIDGGGGVTKNGTGTLILENANGYTGGTTINDGALEAKDNYALGAGAVRINSGGKLTLNYSDGTFTNGLTGAGTLNTKGNIIIDQNNLGFNGTTNIERDKNSNSTKLTLKKAGALGTSQININGSSALEFNLTQYDSGSTDNEINITDGQLIKSGDGVLTLTNPGSNYAGGATRITGGTLNITGSSSLTFGDIYNSSALNFISSPAYSTPTTINITGGYSGSGVVGLEASLTGGAGGQWVDKLVFDNNPSNTVNVTFNFVSGSNIINMPEDNATSMVFAQVNGNTDGNLFQFANTKTNGNLVGARALSINATNGNQTFYLGTDFSPGGAKVYSEFSAAALAQASEMHTTEFFRAISQAEKDENNDSPGFYLGYGRVDFRQSTGSHADIKGNRMTFGVAWKTDDKTAWGIFGQKFNGSYQTENDVETGGRVHSNGDTRYHDIGLFAEYRPKGQAHDQPGQYYQATIKAGRSSSDFNADNFMGDYTTFHSGRGVFGFSLGGGYIKPLADNKTLEYYNHLIYTRLDGDNTTDSINQKISLHTAESVRMLTGARLNFNQNKKTVSYVGAALDYEFSGKAGATIDGYKANSADLKGLTGIIELGVKSNLGKDNSLTIEGSLQGYIGKKKGLGGTVALSKHF